MSKKVWPTQAVHVLQDAHVSIYLKDRKDEIINFPIREGSKFFCRERRGYPRTGEFEQENSTSARATNLEIFLMHRPQQFFLSFSSKEEVSFFGQVIPALPNS